MRAAWSLVGFALASACGRKEPAPPPVPTPVTTARSDASPQDIVARTVCDWYWRSSSANARPYPSLDECIAAETKPRACDAKQADACAAFARDAKPGTGNGLDDSPDCAACLAPAPDPALAAAFAEQRAARERAKLTVHSARIHTRAWPKDLEEVRDASKIVVVLDIELGGYGYRIDPDDFVLDVATADPKAEAAGSWPYTERLTRSGKPTTWTDPAVIDDPDLRMRAYFALPKTASAESLVVSYDGKRSAPFKVR
jgi:hypothetical protein